MKKLIFLLLFLPTFVLAQFTEDFESGDISGWTQSSTERWAASDVSPINGDYSLHHIFDNPDSGEDQISIELPSIDLTTQNVTWRFKILHAYNPSSSNHWGVFILSDTDAYQMHPGGTVNGYIAGVNLTGYDDTLRLWKITNGTVSEVITTNINWQEDIGTSTVPALEIIRSTNGNWEFKINPEGDFNNTYSIGTGNDSDFTFTDFFGIFYKYSSAQDMKLWIDDIYFGHEILDTIPPQVSTLEIIHPTRLRIDFTERVGSSAAVNPNNYYVDNGMGNPESVVINEMQNSVELIFGPSFMNETFYEIDICNIIDLEDNMMADTTIPFSYFVAEPFHLVINEIMADPSPVVGLPEYEYMEIFNTTDYDISLTGWTISVGSTEKEIPETTIQAGEYIIVCSQNAAAELQNFGKTVAFSSLQLTNSGQTLTLKDNDGKIISSVSYTNQWYKNEYKADGGWSLEQIDPFNPCGEENNWEASKNENGGTPGQLNSVDANNPDIESPELLRAAITDENTVQLFFSESLHPETAKIKQSYQVSQGFNQPDSIEVIAPENKSVLLHFTQPFTPVTTYEVEIVGNITDCSGNHMGGKTSAKFAIPQIPEKSDLVINEILFNPFAGGVDFVEIYNRSDKVFDLYQLRIASYDDDKNDYKSVAKASDEGHLIFPGEYKVITESPNRVMEQYYTPNPYGFAKISSLPAYNNDKGRVIIMDKSENTIDNFAYTEDMHFALLASNNGVSLERINYDRPTDDKTNWHSASEVVGFATPAYENSQFNPQLDRDEKITVDPEIFSPDNDGYQDVTHIIFNTEEPGYVANIKIFDSRGRLIKYLANNLLLGINQTITWDGLDHHNQKASMGVYVVFVELFDLEGNVKQYKKSVVVASKLQ